MSFARAIATVGGLTLISRILGFIRDQATAAILGAGPVADAFFVALRLPNLFRRLFAEGAFSVAFVPLFAGTMERDGKEAAARFAEETQAVMLAILGGLTAVALLFMPWVLYVLVPGFTGDTGQRDLTIALCRISFPYLTLISIAALQGGVLNALDRYGPFATAPIIFNICLILGLALTPFFPTAGHALAWGEFAAGFVQVAWMMVSCRRAGVALGLRRPRLTPMVRRLFVIMAPAAVGAGAVQINIVIDTMIASLLPHGAISYLYYAERLYQLPLGIIGIAVGTALLPMLSRQVKAGNVGAARDLQCRAIEFSLLLSLPAAVALAVAGGPIVQALFARGRFSTADAHASALALVPYACGIPAYVLAKTLSTAFFAREDTRAPLNYSLVTVATNTVLALTLSLGLGLGYVGIAAATGVTAWLNVGMLARGLRRRGLLVLDTRLKRAAPRILLATLVMALALVPLARGVDPWLAGPFWRQAVALLVVVGGGAAAYGLAIVASGAAGLSDVRRMLRRTA